MNGYFLLFDLLGFSNMVSNLPHEDLHSRMIEWRSLVERAASESSVSKVSMLSDSVFAAADSSEEGLRSLMSMGKNILNEGVVKSFPVKGAISHGEYTWESFVYGKAVIDAHELESQQAWIGISCTNGLPHIEFAWGANGLICYPTPKKSGAIRLHPVISWDPPDFDKLVAYICQKGLVKKGETLPWTWADKVQHTIIFSLYRHMLIATGGIFDKFRGVHPVQLIEMNLKPAQPAAAAPPAISQ